MLKSIKYLSILILAMTLSCQKDRPVPEAENNTGLNQTSGLELEKVKEWYNQQDTSLNKLKPDWNSARLLVKQDKWLIRIAGSPTFQGIKQGMRKLLIGKDSAGIITAKIMEIIPDAYTLQEFGRIPKGKFSGRIMIYTADRQLESGKLFSSGKISGEIKQAKYSTKKLMSMKGEYTHPNATSRMAEQAYSIYETCSWYDSAYIDGDGIFTIHSERLCTYQIYQDGYYYDGGNGGGYNGPSDYYDQPSGGGGGGSSPDPTPEPEPTVPEPSNLPGEEQPAVDPKKMMDCFAAISNPNAAFVVRVHVQEPMPGTSFNIGPNSYGHVALELSVISGDQNITQVIGYYPSGSGPDKMVSTSRIVNNGDMAYNVSATFYVNQANFQKIVDFAANPPQGYHFQNYNCTSFAYDAASLGGISLPMGYTTVGLAGPGGVTTAQTPAGMGSELRGMKASNPTMNINTAGGKASASKGECN